MGNSIKPHIERAEKTGACNLSKQGLTEFPAELLRLAKNLRTLDLSDNKIAGIPAAVGNLAMLKNFNMNSNRLSILPDDIGKLKKLEQISFNFNRLTGLPPTLAHLSALKTVSLNNNKLTVFPTQLCHLKHMDVIDLSHNVITQIPDEVKELHAIEINLNENRVNRVSECVAECPRLKVLRLEENCLEITALSPKIMKDSQISLLAVDGNVFDMKQFHGLEGYEEYMERYTATKKKFN